MSLDYSKMNRFEDPPKESGKILVVFPVGHMLQGAVHSWYFNKTDDAVEIVNGGFYDRRALIKEEARWAWDQAEEIPDYIRTRPKKYRSNEERLYFIKMDVEAAVKQMVADKVTSKVTIQRNDPFGDIYISVHLWYRDINSLWSYRPEGLEMFGYDVVRRDMIIAARELGEAYFLKKNRPSVHGSDVEEE